MVEKAHQIRRKNHAKEGESPYGVMRRKTRNVKSQTGIFKN